MTEEQVFLAALDVPDRAARIAYLDEVCGQNGELRRQVEELLAAHERSGQFLDEPAAEQIAAGGPQSLKDQTLAFNNAEVDGMADNKKTQDECDDLNFLSPSTRPDSLGRLGHYEMLQVLGRGGFGIVFRAFDDTLQRVVAVKVMAPQIATLSPARKRFLREARSSAAVRHENVVQVYEVGEQPLPFLTMEFIPGETLQQKLDRTGPLEVSEVLRIGRQIAEGLAAAHACDLIHRDIKPGNILLEGGSHKVKITDFGLARAADDASISQSGVIAGTPMFMAPEQALGHKIDRRADLFSLGSVLYQMVSGRPPFRAPSALAVLKRVAEEPPRPIPEIIPETPAWLCEIIAKLQAKNPDERYQSAREVADVLADCEAQLKAHGKVKDYSRIPRSKPQRSGRLKWLAAAAAVLVPVLVVALTEITGVTHLLYGPRALQVGDSDADKPFHQTTTKELPPARSYALQFDGEGNYVDIPSLSYDGGPITVEALVQVERRKLAPIVKGIGKEMIGTWLDEESLGVSGGVRGTPEYTALKIELGHQVYHIAGVFDGLDDIRLYLDGKSVGKRSRGVVNPVPRGGFAIGGEPGLDRGAPRAFFAGIIDEVRVSKVVRYDKDFTPILRHTPDRETLALYHCDEGEGDILKDSTGNGHHGKIVGAKWVKADGSPLDTKRATPAIAPFTEADFQRIAALPAALQVEEVRKELKRRNPGFDGKMETKIEGGIVTEFRIVTDKVTDIAPIRVFDALRVLDCSGTNTYFGPNNLKPNGLLADLTPLKGMKLAALTHLNLRHTKVSDEGLVHFKSCKNLTHLYLGWTKVSDAGLANFKDCKNLTHLWVNDMQVGDAGMVHFQDCKTLTNLNLAGTKVSGLGLTHFKDCKHLNNLFLDRTQVGDRGLVCFAGMPLRVLAIDNTRITDLTPLQGIPLEDIRLTPKKITKGLDILRDMKSLKTIGISDNQVWPAAEFWERYDKGEFTK